MPVDPRNDQSKDTPKVTSQGPPRLRLHLMHHLKVLAVLNVVPLIGGLYVWWQMRQGRVTLRSMSSESQSTLVVVVVSGVAFAVIMWFIMPVARWLRDYPTWHLRRGPAWAWVIPAAGGWAAWIILSLAGILAAAAAVLLAGIGLWNLFAKAG